MSKRNQQTNYGNIIVTTLAIVAGACTVIWFALKLYRKYCLLDGYDYDEEFDDLYVDDAPECEVVLEGEQESEAEAVEAENA